MMGAADPARSGWLRTRLPMSLRLLLLASLAVPLGFLLGSAWHDHRRLHAEAHADLTRLSAIAREHALKVVETNALVLDHMADRIRGLSWDEVEARGQDIHRWLRGLDDGLAQISSLHLARPDGRVAALSIAWPTPPLLIADRAYFRRLREGEQSLVFGEPMLARLTGIVTFAIARRREGADGQFDGVLLGSVLPGYFQAQWHAMDPEGQASFALLRTDGQVLASHPSAGNGLFDPPEPGSVPEAVRHPSNTGPAIERFGERREWLTAFRQVGEYPLVVSVTLSLDQIRAQWLTNTTWTATFCLAVALALGFTTWLAIRRWRSEQAVLHRLSQSRDELSAEILRREAAEAGLLQSQRLESLGRLTGGVAHDFNNLLTAILGTVHLLERHLGGADERTRKYLGLARDAVQRGARLNASLLAFARQQRLHAASLDANELVRGFAPLIQRALGESATLVVEADPDLPPCRADAAQLEAALLNLAINARDAMPRGGTMTLSTRTAWLGAERLAGNTDAKPGLHVAIALRDTGTGMPPEVQERAFEPFFTTKPLGKGTGLGLSQVFGFIRQLGGHVAIGSAPGEGTTVTLFLPAAAEAPAQEPGPSSVMPERLRTVARATVLVVEDDERVREVTAETLRDAGFRVIAVPDAPEALALLQGREAFDLLFSDIVMPGGMTGIELAQEAGHLRPLLPVLLATGYAGLAEGPAEHGFEVLAKPYDQAALVRRIAELVTERQRVA
ncbi:response regulator [Belnapia sp. T18]|uniref:histidine kinase n=1 Tax=Belnapia arida TaxID=2804533 RepID=A0ABS1UB49_9PROT|nr:hybrid sensor histidine kinase/response regulator [Belnapia arida]MBL6081159.1 response regulator [Belnapia arida]